MKQQTLRQIQSLLAAIPAGKAAELALALRAMPSDADSLPVAAMLDALVPPRHAGLDKRPPLFDLVLLALEPFLTEAATAETGLIPRSIIAPWWEACTLLGAGRLAQLALEAKEIDDTAFAALGITLRVEAAAWTEAVATGAAPPAALTALSKTHGWQESVSQIREILQSSAALMSASERLIEVARYDCKLHETQIVDLSTNLVDVATDQYRRLSETDPIAAKYFALGVLNRLEKPWHIFRLTRALALQRDATIVANTEFGHIGLRLLANLENIGDAVSCGNPRGRMSAHLVDFDNLRELAGRFTACAEGLVEEVDLRRDSEWGEIMLRARGKMREALDTDRLQPAIDAILAVFPEKPSRATRQRGQQAATINDLDTLTERALAAVRLLHFLFQRGGRHGFASAARAALEDLYEDVAQRSEDLIADLRATPNDAALSLRLESAITLVAALFQDERGKILLRRLGNERGARTPPA